MRTWVNVVRLHFVDPLPYSAGPWLILTFCYCVALTVFAAIPVAPGDRNSGMMFAIYAGFFVIGLLSMLRSLPFALSLGVSRRSYLVGTTLVAVLLAVADGLLLTVLKAIESGTGGWGVGMNFFRVPYILDGPWYLTWLTSFILLTVVFLYGIWLGLAARRWGVLSMWILIVFQLSVAVTWALATTWLHGWTDVSHFFTSLTPTGLTGLLAALAVILFGGGLTTIRRVAV